MRAARVAIQRSPIQRMIFGLVVDLPPQVKITKERVAVLANGYGFMGTVRGSATPSLADRPLRQHFAAPLQ